MKFLREPQNGIWVAVQEELDERDVARRILSSDVCLTDLDDTDAYSPAKYMAKRAMGTSHFNFSYVDWVLESWVDLIFGGKNSESRCWRSYVDRFLRNPEALESVRSKFTEEFAREFLYFGVENFYTKLGDARKFYVTRNILEAVIPFGSILDFTGIFAGVDDKSRFIEGFVREFPYFQRYLFKGDSEEDQEALDVLRFFKRRGTIEDVIACHVAANSSERSMNGEFDVNIGRDYRVLVDLLAAYSL